MTHGQFKPEAPLVIPWFKRAYTEPGRSVCQHHWIAIRKGNRTCYAQWEDCGPFRTDHFQYVFQGERPKPNLNHGAGLDVSPAVRDYLGFSRPTSPTGSLSKCAKFRQGRGEATETTTISFWPSANWSSAWSSRTQATPKSRGDWPSGGHPKRAMAALRSTGRGISPRGPKRARMP